MKVAVITISVVLLAGCTFGGEAEDTASEASEASEASDAEERYTHIPPLTLVCTGDDRWRVDPVQRKESGGTPSPYDVLEVELQPYAERLDAEILYDDVAGAVSAEGRLVVRSTAMELSDGTWTIHATYGCGSEVEPIQH